MARENNMSLVAKTIVKDQLWVLVDGGRKIGNVEADNSGFNVKIGDRLQHYADTKSIEQTFEIIFDDLTELQTTEDLSFAKWPTSTNTYNNSLDVQRKVHVYTQTPESTCHHCAGYFNILLNDEWVTEFCPKYIFIQRYDYTGPYMTEEQAILDK